MSVSLHYILFFFTLFFVFREQMAQTSAKADAAMKEEERKANRRMKDFKDATMAERVSGQWMKREEWQFRTGRCQ
jgi:ATP-dependent Zn protease